MTLSGYRVIGIEASPPELTPDDAVSLRVHEFYEGEESLSYERRVCLASLGAKEEYECQQPSFEFVVGDEAALALELGPAGLDVRRKLEAFPPSLVKMAACEHWSRALIFGSS